MVTEMRQALRDAADRAAPAPLDLDGVVTAGARRRRRRRLVTAGAASFAVALVVGVGTVSTDRGRDEVPSPAGLRLEDARTVDLRVAASRRVMVKDARDADLSYDRFEGITDDGLVVRGTYSWPEGVRRFGLLDVDAGRTEWLPPAPGNRPQPRPVHLGADRLVFLGSWVLPSAILVFDRDSRAWKRHLISVPEDEVGRFYGYDAQLGGDGRVYLMDPEIPVRWWSVPLAGGRARPEPTLDGKSVVWSGTTLATADPDGRVTVTRDGQRVTEIDGPPEGCAAPDDMELAPALRLAGTRPVVTFRCETGQQVVVYDEAGRPDLILAPAEVVVTAADARYVVLAEPPPARPESADDERTYLLDLQRRVLLAIDDRGLAIADDDAYANAIRAGLVLWMVNGPSEGRDTYDVVYKVARVP